MGNTWNNWLHHHEVIKALDFYQFMQASLHTSPSEASTEAVWWLKVPIRYPSWPLSSLHHKQKEHFVFIFDYVVKNNSSETEDFIYPQEQKQVKQQLCESWQKQLL